MCFGNMSGELLHLFGCVYLSHRSFLHWKMASVLLFPQEEIRERKAAMLSLASGLRINIMCLFAGDFPGGA